MGTITSVEPIEVPSYVTAASLTLRVSSVLFTAFIGSKHPSPRIGGAWYAMRAVAQRFMDNKSLDLLPADAQILFNGCSLAHELAHDCLPGPTPEMGQCPCELADQIHSIFDLIAEARANDKPAA